jgi:hypothetical protein
MTNQAKVALEVAEAEFIRWADAMRIDLDVTGLDADDVKSLEQNKRRVIKALQCGALVIDDAGQAIYTPGTTGVSALTFHKPTAAVLMSLDESKADQSMHRQQNLIAAITRAPKSVLARLEMADHGDCKAIVGFLLSPGQ